MFTFDLFSLPLSLGFKRPYYRVVWIFFLPVQLSPVFGVTFLVLLARPAWPLILLCILRFSRGVEWKFPAFSFQTEHNVISLFSFCDNSHTQARMQERMKERGAFCDCVSVQETSTEINEKQSEQQRRSRYSTTNFPGGPPPQY